MWRLTNILLTIMLVGCYNVADKPVIVGKLPKATTTMAMLRADIVGSGGVVVADDVMLRGRVTSSDAEDSFYRTLVVEDATGGVEVMLGLYSLAAIYPEGLEVALHVGGLYADYSRGVLQLGLQPELYDSFAVDYLGSREAADRVVVRGEDVRAVVPRMSSIAALRREDCGMLFCIEDLSLLAVDDEEDIGRATWRGYALFSDDAGDSIVVYTSDYARFADAQIPHRCSIVGVLQWGATPFGGECYQLKMRYERDCIAR